MMNRSNAGAISFGSLLAIAAVGVGLALVLVPMLPDNRPMEMEKDFRGNSESHRRLLAAASQIDAACESGDLAALKNLLSERYLGELSAGMAGDGDLDALLLAQKEGLIGDFAGETFLHGSAALGRAFMIYRIDQPDLALRAYVFRWNGSHFELAARRTQPKKAWTMPTAQAQASYWGLNFLRGR